MRDQLDEEGPVCISSFSFHPDMCYPKYFLDDTSVAYNCRLAHSTAIHSPPSWKYWKTKKSLYRLLAVNLPIRRIHTRQVSWKWDDCHLPPLGYFLCPLASKYTDIDTTVFMKLRRLSVSWVPWGICSRSFSRVWPPNCQITAMEQGRGWTDHFNGILGVGKSEYHFWSPRPEHTALVLANIW